MTLPVFAVVGHPNKGKSSIVATLAEHPDVAIGPLPGTTRVAREFTFRLAGLPQYVLVDTPGFQRAREVFQWLQSQPGDASDRPAHVRRFVETHRHDALFADEISLLEPILRGASILYVVDGAKPYGAEYELEMQILRWTGQPRMALINRIGPGDFRAQWHQALGQYFSIVRDFDAVGADFETRLGVLRALAELNRESHEAIASVIDAMQVERQRRRHRCAGLIVSQLATSLIMTEEKLLVAGEDRQAVQGELQVRLLSRLREEESTTRAQVESVYGYHALERSGTELPILAGDLFASEDWQLFGLSRQSLVVTAAVGGAAAGGVIDLAVGGASLLLGSLLGSVIGGAGAWLGGGELARARLLGEPLGGTVMRLGPIQAANFPWVLLGRALVHHRLVSERNHAQRAGLALEAGGNPSLLEQQAPAMRRELAKCFQRLRQGDAGASDALRAQVETLLAV